MYNGFEAHGVEIVLEVCIILYQYEVCCGECIINLCSQRLLFQLYQVSQQPMILTLYPIWTNSLNRFLQLEHDSYTHTRMHQQISTYMKKLSCEISINDNIKPTN